MNFPLIAIGCMRLDQIRLAARASFSVARSGSDTARTSLWRLRLDRLSEIELREVEGFIRAVKTRGLWSFSIGRTTLLRCLLLEARTGDWHGRDGISGWIVFSAGRVDLAACGLGATAVC